MFNVNGSIVEFANIDAFLDFDIRINRYGNGLWNYTPKEYVKESIGM